MNAEQCYLAAIAAQAPIEAAAHDVFIEERNGKMLADFESLEQHSTRCSECEEQAVVAWSAEDNPRGGRWYPLCFGCAFVTALAKDEQAQSMALGWAMAEGLRNRDPEKVR